MDEISYSVASGKHFLVQYKTLVYLGPFKKFLENKVLLIRSLESYSRHFIFFVTYGWAQ